MVLMIANSATVSWNRTGHKQANHSVSGVKSHVDIRNRGNRGNRGCVAAWQLNQEPSRNLDISLTA